MCPYSPHVWPRTKVLHRGSPDWKSWTLARLRLLLFQSTQVSPGCLLSPIIARMCRSWVLLTALLSVSVMGHAWLAHSAALRTNVVCMRMRALIGVGAHRSLLCLAKALRALWFMAAVIAATGSAKVRGEPRAATSVPKGWHATSYPPIRKVPPPSGSLYRMAVLPGWMASPSFPSLTSSSEHTLQVVPVMAPKVGVVALFLSPGLWCRGLLSYTARTCAPDGCGGQEVTGGQGKLVALSLSLPAAPCLFWFSVSLISCVHDGPSLDV